MFDTREAGGGSYPEPPYTPEPNIPECEECLSTKDVTLVDGHALCPHCKAEWIFLHADYDDYMRFIRDTFDDQKDFFIKWFFDNLSTMEKLAFIKPAFERITQEERELQVTSYVREHKYEFSEFMEAHDGDV